MSHPEDDYQDYAQEAALDDLFRQYTLEYKNDLAHAALLKTTESVDVVQGTLAEARKVMSVSPTAAYIFAASACEITLKDLFFIPVLSGLIHDDFGVSVVVKLLARIARDQMTGPLTALLKRSTFINLDETKRKPDGDPILIEVGKVAKKRNTILHAGERVDEASAEEALAIADYLLNDTFQSLLGLHKLYMTPGDRLYDWIGKPYTTIMPILSPPSDEDRDPWA